MQLVISATLVSVVLATNRNSPFLARTIQSVINQTWQEWELIVVDDGSGVADFIDAAAAVDSRCRTIHLEPSGLSIARNIGVRETSGDLVVFLDDDDTWNPQRLEKQVSALDADPVAVACYCLGVFVNEKDEVTSRAWGPVGTREDFLRGASPPPRIVTLMVRRDTFLALGGFMSAFRMAEDNEFILRLLQHGGMAGVSQDLVNYRVHSSNMSMTSSADGLLSAGGRVLSMQIYAAGSRGDTEIEQFLREHQQRFVRSSSKMMLKRLVSQFRRGKISAAVKTLLSLAKFFGLSRIYLAQQALDRVTIR